MHSYVVLITTILTTTKATPLFTLLETFTGLTDNNGTTESCAYDSFSKQWVFTDRESWNAEVDTLPGTYPWRALTNDIENKFKTGNNIDGYDYSNVLGTAYASGKLFLADSTGEVVTYGVNGQYILNSYSIGIAGINGICYDESTQIIYATNVGVDFNTYTYVDANAGIWKIDRTVLHPVATRVYDGGSDTVNDQTGAEKTNYVFHPNGCAVKDGVIYFVETRIDGSGALGMLTVGNDILSIDDSKGTMSGDGIVVIGDYIIYSAWRNDNNNGGALYYTDITTDNSFSLGIEGLTSPANIGVGPMNTICVPSLTTGNLYFVKFNLRPILTKIDKNLILYDTEDDSGDYVFAFNLAFDPIRQKFAYLNHNALDTSNMPDLIEVGSQWAADTTGTITESGFIGSDQLIETVIPSRDDSKGAAIAPWWHGSAIANDILYGTDSYGLLFGQELETEHVIGYVDFGDYADNFNNYLDATGNDAATGVCIDPDNPTNAYVMDGIYGKIWKVDVSSIDSNNNYGTPVNLYDGTTILDQNGENGRKFYPYQCTIFNGHIYMVECDICWEYTNNGDTGSFGIFKISDNSFEYNTNVLSTTASSIASVNGIIVITPLVKIDAASAFMGFGVYDPSVDPMLDIQYFEYTLDSKSRQIAIDYYNGIIASVEDVLYGESEMVFWQSNEFRVPTVEPTKSPSVVPTQTPIVPTQTPTAIPTGDTGKASDVVNNIAYITMFLVLMVNYIN